MQTISAGNLFNVGISINLPMAVQSHSFVGSTLNALTTSEQFSMEFSEVDATNPTFDGIGNSPVSN